MCGEFLFYDFTETSDGTCIGELEFRELHHLRAHPRARGENMRMNVTNKNDVSLLQADLAALATAYPSQDIFLFDLSTADTGRGTIEAVTSIAQTAPPNVHIVLSTGFHMGSVHPPTQATPKKTPPPSLKATMLSDLKVTQEDDLSRYYFSHSGEVDESPPLVGCVACSPERCCGEDSLTLIRGCLEVAKEANNPPVHIIMPYGIEVQSMESLLECIVQNAGGTVCLHNVLYGENILAVLKRYSWLRCSFDWFAWDGLASMGKHPYGYEMPSLKGVRDVLKEFEGVAGQLSLGTLHAMKLCSPGWGGPGRGAAIEAAKTFLAEGALSASATPFAWWTPPRHQEPTKVYWACTYCAVKTEEALPDRSFRRGEARYCSVKCLREDTPEEEEKQKKGGRSGGGGGGCSWGVACPS